MCVQGLSTRLETAWVHRGRHPHRGVWFVGRRGCDVCGVGAVVCGSHGHNGVGRCAMEICTEGPCTAPRAEVVLRSEKHLLPWDFPGSPRPPPALSCPAAWCPREPDGSCHSWWHFKHIAQCAGVVLADVSSTAPAKGAADAGTVFLSFPNHPSSSLGERVCPEPAAELWPQQHRCRLHALMVGASGRHGSCGHPMGTAAVLLGYSPE